MSIFIICVVIIIIIVILYKYFKKEDYTDIVKDVNDIFYVDGNDERKNTKIWNNGNWQTMWDSNISPSRKYKDEINYAKKYSSSQLVDSEYFVDNKFNQDYIDVINALQTFENISPNGKHLFNPNNIPVITTKDKKDNHCYNENIKNFNFIEIGKLGIMCDNFITTLQETMNETTHLQRESLYKWETLPEQNYKDGFEEVQDVLGLPTKLYTKNVIGTDIKLDEFSNIVKYETENEINYKADLLISRKKSRDKMLVRVSFVIDKIHPDKVIVENTNVVGYVLERKLSKSYMNINNKYNFDNLDNNNMLDISKIMDELEYKYKINEQIMQDKIENLDPDDRFAHMRIDPTKYKSYLATQTIYEDVYGEKHFE